MGDIALSGSCLCGSVAYELQGDARRFYHCHCERCRKASGHLVCLFTLQFGSLGGPKFTFTLLLLLR